MFKPACYLCGLEGGIMRPTNCVILEARKTPGCESATWTSNNTRNMPLSGITRKERDYQVILYTLFHIEGKDIASYAETFVHWVHLSCCFWSPEIYLQ